MQFTVEQIVLLPNVPVFSLAITGIRVSDYGNVLLTLLDTSGNSFAFDFNNGFVTTDRIVGTYNTIDETNITGYFSGGVFNYKVNDIYCQSSGNFGTLNGFHVEPGSTTVNLDVIFNGKPINYSVSIAPAYPIGGALTGTIISDTPFRVASSQLTFYSSNADLLANPYSNGLNVASGINNLSFSDLDISFFEYTNGFTLSMPTTFGNIGQKFSTERTGVGNNNILSLSDGPENTYYQTSPFNGSWSGNTFIYSDNPVTYNANFNYSCRNFIGNDVPATVHVSFFPLTPANGSGYGAQYVTNFVLTNNGNYSQPPTFSGAQYYYVTGLQNSLQSFLFSSGCGNSINVTFSGGNPISGASGVLLLKPIKISGVYNSGVATYKIVSGYSGISDGFGYQSPPTFILSTGGGCYSLPDFSGVSLYQFYRATGYGAVYAQAAGLTGLVVMNGSGVSGVQVTSLGLGYTSAMPPTVKFVRATGDTAIGDASGHFQFKTSGLYAFDQFWSVLYSFGNDFAPLNDCTGYFSGSFNVGGAGNLQMQLLLSGLDNTVPVSGLLNVNIVGGGYSITAQRVISQSRTFNLSTGALLPESFPTFTFTPLPDLSYAFDTDQFDTQYQSALGSKVDAIINF